jgi:predicted transcriptional regulator
MAARTSVTRVGLVVCALLCALVAAAAARADPAAPLYEPYAVAAIDLELPPASFEALEKDPDSDYVEGTFSLAQSSGSPSGIGAFSTPLTVGIRLKGGTGSFRALKDEKAAFKIKFNEFVKGQKFLGLKKMTLNNMVQDPSMLHETLAYEAFGSLGVPASRTGYAYVRVNGADYGVYLNIETLDDVSLPLRFGSTRHLYEADAPGTDVSGAATDFEVDEGDDEDLSDLEALIAAANDEEGDWSDGMAAVADLEEMTRMWAVERYVGHWDGYAGVDAPFRPNNYYLHSEDTGPGAGVFQVLPWGTDQTWLDPVEFGEPAGGLMFNECFADASCAALYRGGLDVAGDSIDALDLSAQASCLAELLAPWQALEDEERREFDAAEIEEGVEDARDFVLARPQELDEWLASQPPGAGAAPGGAEAAPCGPPAPDQEPGPGAEGPGGSPGEVAIASPDPMSAGALADPVGLRFARAWVRDGFLAVKVRLAGPGLLSERATAASGKRKVCSARIHAQGPGAATVRCRLSATARSRLREGPLRLQVTVRFKPQGGEAETLEREIVAPRAG